MKSEKSEFKTIFTNPYVSFFGSMASILSIIIAIYFYHKSQLFSEFTYLINSQQMVIINKIDSSNKLKVLYNGKELKENVYAVQIAIWNNGNKSIKNKDILENLFIEIPGKNQILDAKIIKQTRDVSDIHINQISNTLSIGFKILEEDDGGIIQLIYSSKSKKEPIIKGTIVGQKKILKRTVGMTLDKLKPIESMNSFYTIILFTFIGFTFLVMLLIPNIRESMIKDFETMFHKNTTLDKLVLIIIHIMTSRVFSVSVVIVFLAAALYLLITDNTLYMPFEF